MTAVARQRHHWAQRIQSAWQKSLEAVFECGRLLIEAKGTLDHGDFLAMIGADLPFEPRTAQRLMAIARDSRLANATHGSHLPTSWRTLYELTKLDDKSFLRLLSNGVIRPDMERRDVAGSIKKERREERERQLAQTILALPEKLYGGILSDPEWRWDPWSRETGMDRAADNHFPTSPLEVIKSRDVASIAASDCSLFLWATVPMLPQALEVMAAWEFEYRSHLIWDKTELGNGYWFRNQHELLLLGTCGQPPAPAPGTQWPSVIKAPRGAHSEKPDIFYELIEAYFPTLPKIELNARRRRAGWDAWGLEAPDDKDEAA